MADAANTVATLNGNFKETYANEVKDLKPKMLMARNDFKFIPRKQRPGNNFHAPVSLTHEQGFTYSAAGAGAFSLEDAEAGIYKDASIVGTQLVLKSLLDYETAARAARKSPGAFRAGVQLLFENMTDSTFKRLEIDFWNGQRGLAVVESVNHSTDVFVVTAATWATGIWAGQENAKLEFFDGVAAAATKRTGTDTYGQITAVDIDNRQITCGDLPTDVVAGDYVWFKTARTATAHNSFAGVDAIQRNTGTIFGIAASSYSLWQTNSISVGNDNLAFQDVNQAVAKAYGKGLEEDVNLYCSPPTWANLLDEEISFRRWTGPGRPQYRVGAENIEFFSQNGKISIKASNYIKEGQAHLLAPRRYSRVGATDVTFNLPDRGDEFFRHVEGKAAYELRCYSNQALFTNCPGQGTILTDIVNTTA